MYLILDPCGTSHDTFSLSSVLLPHQHSSRLGLLSSVADRRVAANKTSGMFCPQERFPQIQLVIGTTRAPLCFWITLEKATRLVFEGQFYRACFHSLWSYRFRCHGKHGFCSVREGHKHLHLQGTMTQQSTKYPPRLVAGFSVERSRRRRTETNNLDQKTYSHPMPLSEGLKMLVSAMMKGTTMETTRMDLSRWQRGMCEDRTCRANRQVDLHLPSSRYEQKGKLASL